jgi:hypothetical protein
MFGNRAGALGIGTAIEYKTNKADYDSDAGADSKVWES